MNSIPHSVVESSDSLLIPGNISQEKEEKERTICVDGETVPLMGPVQVKVLKDSILMFCSKAEAVSERRREEPSSVSRWSSLVRPNKL